MHYLQLGIGFILGAAAMYIYHRRTLKAQADTVAAWQAKK